jgi:hypothetical protein
MTKSLISNRFGRLVVKEEFKTTVSESGVNARKRSDGQPYVRYRYFCKCMCDCGGEKIIRRDALLTLKNPTKSCGCLAQEALEIGRKGTHCKTNTKVYRAWSKCKERCYNQTCKRYPKYGGRGITVCDRWKNSFENFYADMGDPPSREHTLGRIDNDKGYTPDNCRWETPTEQMNNTSRNRFIEFDDRIQTISQWSKEIGLRPGTLRRRIVDLNIPLETAMQAGFIHKPHLFSEIE